MNPTFSPTTTTNPTTSPTANLIPVQYAISLCGAICSPWGDVNFPDQTANWIWNDGNARSFAAANYIQFNKDFTSSSSYTGTIYAHCDNYCYIYFNNQFVAYQGLGEYRITASVNVVVGSNTIIVVAWNHFDDNPAGFIGSLHNPSNSVIVHTDNSWVWSFVSSSTSFVPTVPTPQPTTSTLGSLNYYHYYHYHYYHYHYYYYYY